MVKKEALNLEESEEGYTGGQEDLKGEMVQLIYNLRKIFKRI